MSLLQRVLESVRRRVNQQVASTSLLRVLASAFITSIPYIYIYVCILFLHNKLKAIIDRLTNYIYIQSAASGEIDHIHRSKREERRERERE